MTIRQDADVFVDGGRSMHLAELSGGILAQFCWSITDSKDRWRGCDLIFARSRPN